MMFIKERDVYMVISESRLRRIIRSVIVESIDGLASFDINNYDVEITLDGFHSRSLPAGHGQKDGNDCLNENNVEYYRSALMLSLAYKMGVTDYTVVSQFNHDEFNKAFMNIRRGNDKQLLLYSCIENTGGGFTLYFKHMHSSDCGRLIAKPHRVMESFLLNL